VDEENRGRYDRGRLRYPSDLTDEEWALVEPLIAPAKRGSNKRTVDVREVVNGLLYVLSSGCQASDPEGPAPRAARCTTILTCGRGRHARSQTTRALCTMRGLAIVPVHPEEVGHRGCYSRFFTSADRSS
jgi:transposase